MDVINSATFMRFNIIIGINLLVTARIELKLKFTLKNIVINLYHLKVATWKDPGHFPYLILFLHASRVQLNFYFTIKT